MFKHTLGPWMACSLLIILGGCDSITSLNLEGTKQKSGQSAHTSSALSGPALATVNGRPITKDMFDAYLEQRSQRKPVGKSAEELKAVLKELIDLELVLEDAERKGVDQQPALAAQLELQRRSLLVRTNLQEYVRSHPVTEAEIKALYEKQSANLDKEYKARHILTKTEEDALDIISRLDSGQDFEQLAKDYSTGPSANQAGDLGWFPPNRMVAPFSEAVIAMEKGAYSKAPVQTQFGWHVILLEDVRDTTPPTFEQSKGQITAKIRGQRVELYIEELRNAAQIEIKATPESKVEAGTGTETDPAPAP